MTLRPLFLAALLLPAAVYAEAYRWVDASGQVHYTQMRPPKGIAGSYVPPPPPPPGSPNQDALNNSLSKDQKAEPERQKQADAAATAKAANDAQCGQVTQQLVTLNAQTSNRLRVTEEQYQARRKELDDFLAKHCR